MRSIKDSDFAQRECTTSWRRFLNETVAGGGGHADVLFALLFRVSFVVEEKSALASARQEKSTRQMDGVMLIG